jgi:hypothetical protein
LPQIRYFVKIEISLPLHPSKQAEPVWGRMIKDVDKARTRNKGIRVDEAINE